jgi:hypothetical protein
MSFIINNEVDINEFQASLPTGTNQIGKVGYTLKQVSTSFNRPVEATPTAYTQYDAVTNNTGESATPTGFTFDLSSIVTAGQAIEIRKVVVISNTKQTVLPFFNIFLSPTTFTHEVDSTVLADNSELGIGDITMEAGGVWLECDTQTRTSLNSICAKSNVGEPMILDSTTIYGVLQANNAYTPISEEKFTIILWIALL